MRYRLRDLLTSESDENTGEATTEHADRTTDVAIAVNLSKLAHALLTPGY
jgi:hypothetical protein